MNPPYQPPDKSPSREEIDRTPGLLLVDFGVEWCPHCRRLAPVTEALVAEHPEIRHLRVEDGSRRPLGRSFRVKLWPNLVFIEGGTVLKQLARPEPEELRAAFEAVTASA